MAKLIISRDSEVLQTVALSKERMTIGRHRSNDIVLEHMTVSGHHALIVTILDDSFLEDLSSTNGTFVNGHRIGKHFLQNNDQITLAKYQVQFVADNVRPSSAAAQLERPVEAQLVADVDDAEPLVAQIRVLNGANAGKQLKLVKPQTTLGRTGVQVVVISRSGNDYALTQVEGGLPALVNDVAVAGMAHPLRDGDVIDLAGTKMAFSLSGMHRA